MKIPTIGNTLPAREERDWVTTHELIAETSLTYRRVDYWIRTGLITTLDDPTPGTGFVRRLAADQVARAHAIAALLDAGVALQVVRDVVDELVATGHATSGQLTFTLNKSGDTAA